MIKLTFKTDHMFEMIIDKVKYVYNDDLLQYWTIKKAFFQMINKKQKSEYANENNIFPALYIDDEAANKYDEFFFVHSNFDIDDDFKLGTKSLVLRYLNTRLNCDNDILDNLYHLKTMLNYFASLLSDERFVVESSEDTNKLITRLMKVIYLKEEFYANASDLDLDELVCFQLRLINEAKDVGKRTFVLVETPFLNSNIISQINAMDKCHIIVLFNKVSSNTSFDNNLVVDTLDLENEEKLYERMMLMSKYYDINEYRIQIKKEFLSKIFK